MKFKVLLTVLVCIVVLGGCNTSKDEGIAIAPPDFSSEEGIVEYLVGEWVYDKEYVSDITCNMNIDEDLNVSLSFYDGNVDENKGEYTGKIKFDRIYAEPNEAPDLLVIELTDTDYPGGDFFFLHRTIYDDKRVMSLFFAGNGNCIFDMFGPDDYQYAPPEILFEKVTGEKPQVSPIKNKEFTAVFWGKGEDGQSVWIDDVQFTPSEEGEFTALYPWRMTLYTNEIRESGLYPISTDMVSEIYGDDLFPGDVYYVQTDEQGNIIYFMNAEYESNMLEGGDGYDDPEYGALLFDIIENDIDEIRDYIDSGLEVSLTRETVTLNAEKCQIFHLGERHNDEFWPEKTYAVNVYTRQVYFFDEYNDSWEPLGSG